MALTQQNIRQLRGLAHKLKPVIILGKAGFSESVLNELELALTHHELVKIKLNEADKTNRNKLIDQITQKTKADMVQAIGHVLVIYRPSDNKVIELQ